jgi:tetratricopeptide (TPR) repeat protein
MLTIKKRSGVALAVLLLATLTGCGPPGARDLRKGERLIQSGEPAAAIPVLNEALQILHDAPPAAQANAWNLLGLAYHGTGQFDAASRAYLQALKLDRNLWAADYNMGCLRLEQTNFPGAIDYLTTYTTSHPGDANGFLLLGRTRLKFAMQRGASERTRQLQLDNAKLDFEYAEHLRGTAEACNALGLIELQRHGQGTDAVKTAVLYFQRALQRDPHYPPALLNLAIILQRTEPKAALEKYREYAALQPSPPQANEVEKLARQLDLNLRISIVPQHPSITPAAPTNPSYSRQMPVVANPAPRPAPQPVARPAPVQRPSTSLVMSAPPPVSPPPQPVEDSQPAPVTRTAPPNEAANPPADVTTVEAPPATPPQEKKRSIIKKLNPLTWFSANSKKPEATETPVPPEVGGSDRYAYPLPVTPIPGDRKQAERLNAEGRQAEHQSNRAEAMRDYHEAMQADPTYFEPALALGLVALDVKDYATALDALSQALTVQANSADARYAFAWVLSKRGYHHDAANELVKLLSAHPQEARARLLLGNIYSDNLGEPKLAREQYLKALDSTDSQSPQAATIRAWLDQHP